VRWSFTHYLNIAHPSFATPTGRPVAGRAIAPAAA
jgi:hypothetical protein